MREELAQNRREAATQSKELRVELTNSLTATTDSVHGQIAALSSVTEQRLDSVRHGVEQRLAGFTEDTSSRLDGLCQNLSQASFQLQGCVTQDLSQFRSSLDKGIEGIHGTQKQQTHALVSSFDNLSNKLEKTQNSFSERFESRAKSLHSLLDTKLAQLQSDWTASAHQSREETVSTLRNFSDSVLNTLTEMSRLQSKQFDDIRTTVDSRLSAIQNANEHKLEEMRRTVDEKLQGTLETRLGESFKLVLSS